VVTARRQTRRSWPPFAGASKYTNQGQPVVAGQRLMQASSDIFLGWQRIAAGLDGKPHDFYVRQLRDWKYSTAIEDLAPRGMRAYGGMCGWALARAHACSGDRIAIAAYLGGSDVFDQAITRFAAVYAGQNDRDHQSLVDAAREPWRWPAAPAGRWSPGRSGRFPSAGPARTAVRRPAGGR
jgi:Uncharacterized protein conserved in bacteria (DUF2252)